MATQPDFETDKYYVITKRKVFIFIIVLLGMTIAAIAEAVFMFFLLAVKVLG